jgi:hypothetical protein
MSRKTLIAGTAVVSLGLAGAGTASAARAPTVGPLTIIKAGHGHAIPNNVDWHRGKTLRKGTELRHWLVTVNDDSRANIVLSCGPHGKHIGLTQQNGARVNFAVARGSGYYHRSIRLHFIARPGATATGAQVSLYALCTTS